MKLALRIEVSTLRGTREAAPRVAAALKEHGAGATFLFSLGPDRSGRAPGTLPPAPRLRCYGLATLLSGTLLPAPDIGERGAAAMRALRADGFDTGVLAYDRAQWAARVAAADEAWTAMQMRRACDAYEHVFGELPLVHGAPGWRMNRHAYRHTQRLGFRYSSDTVGTAPFVPVIRGEIVACPQLPTTLPTLADLLAGGLAPDAAVQRLLDASGNPAPEGHVCTLHAEVVGTAFEPQLRALLAGWRGLGCEPVSLQDYASRLDLARLPRRVVEERAAPERHGAVAAEGKEFLA